MLLIQCLILAAASAFIGALLQWWAMSWRYRQAYVVEHRRHVESQRIAAEMLRHCRRQIVHLQSDLSEIREAGGQTHRQPASTTPGAHMSAQETSSDAFADTVFEERHHANWGTLRSQPAGIGDGFAETRVEPRSFANTTQMPCSARS